METSNLPAVVTRELTPSAWSMLEAIARAAHESRKVGVSSQGEAAIKFLFCYENGLPLSAANTGLYIVNGRIAAQSNIIAAQLRKHPSYDYRIKSINDKGCTVEILRRVDGEWRVEGEASFTDADAKRADLDSKDNYKGYPSDMFFNRALARAQRRYAPDVFSQTVYTPEELGAKVDGEGQVIDGSWTELPKAMPTTPDTAPAPQVDESSKRLAELTAKYGAAQVMAANGGKIPATPEELTAVAEKLAADPPVQI